MSNIGLKNGQNQNVNQIKKKIVPKKKTIDLRLPKLPVLDRLANMTVEQILNMTVDQKGIDNLINLLDNTGKIRWKLYGRAAQASSTNATQDPIAAIVEQQTNSFDGVNNG